jgi:hypothetical protein
MTYDSEVAADSPWGYWKTDEASGNLADSSGNSRTMTVTGSPTYAQTGPNGSTADAVAWTNAASQHAETTATTTAGTITLEAWVYLTANPTNTLGIVARSVGPLYTSGASDGELTIDSTGKAGFMCYNGTNRFITAASALSLNTWHHLVGSVGAAGMKLRVDKSTVASNAGVTTAYTGASQKLFMRGGGSRCASISPVTIAKGAYYTTQLSDARTDAHYDAMFVPTGSMAVTLPAPAVSFSGTYVPPGESGSLAVTLPVPTVAFSAAYQDPPTGTLAVTLPVPVVEFSATYDGTIPCDLAVTLPVPAVDFAGTYTPPPITGSLDVTLPVPTVSFAGISYQATGALTITLPAPEVRLVGDYLGPYPTDTSNELNGRARGGGARVLTEVAVEAPPASVTLVQKVDKAAAYPTPTMVDGRPT